MEIKATINVARFIQAMEVKQLKVVDVCAVCGVNNKTLAKILRGEFPGRIDAFYRIINGLQIPISEALIGTTPSAPRLQVLRGGRQPAQIAEN
jgi:transcriptional regulator with XRE-family HTH domain